MCQHASATLQRELARDKQVKLSDSAIRKVLHGAGYKWLPRAQKRMYSAGDMKVWLAFAKRIVRMAEDGYGDGWGCPCSAPC